MANFIGGTLSTVFFGGIIYLLIAGVIDEVRDWRRTRRRDADHEKRMRAYWAREAQNGRSR